MKIVRFLTAIAVFACAGLLFADTIKREILDEIKIDAAGHGEVQRTYFASLNPKLRELHLSFAAQQKEASNREEHMRDLLRGMNALYGSAEPSSRKPDKMSDPPMLREPIVSLGQLARRYDQDPKLAVIDAKAFARDPKRLETYFEFFLDELLFETAFFDSQPKAEEMRTRFTSDYVLPEGSTVENIAELNHLRWIVDFGNGNRIESQLKADRSVVHVIREIVLTRGSPNRLLSADSSERQKVVEQLAHLEEFKILLRPAKGFAATDELSPGDAPTADFNRKWEKSFEMKFSKDIPLADTTLTLAPTVKFTIESRLFWEWDWPARDGFALKQFETGVHAKPGVDLLTTLKIVEVNREWKETINPIPPAQEVVVFWVGLIPVELTLKAELAATAKLEFSAGAEVSIRTSIEGDVGLTAVYRRGTKFDANADGKLTLTTKDFVVDASATGSIRGGLPLTLSALLYDAAGPFLKAEPYLQAKASTDKAEFDKPHDVTWKAGAAGGTLYYGFRAGVETSGGGKLSGWLAGLLGVTGKYTALKKDYAEDF